MNRVADTPQVLEDKNIDDCTLITEKGHKNSVDRLSDFAVEKTLLDGTQSEDCLPSVGTFSVSAKSSDQGTGGDEETSISGGPRFSPPVYIQRYNLVHQVLKERQIKSVVDFGSAECKIVRFLKEVGTVEQIFLVDIDGELLRSSTILIKPQTSEYVRVFCRQRPLTITMLQGSAADLDRHLIGCQAATLVEIIEHLEPKVLPAVTNCIFSKLRPSLVIVTTPNADFNVLFPGFTGFRHWDHKFEWSRQEFQDWCEAVCKEHGYTVTYTGVGDPPQDMSHVGHCSQAAIFTEIAGTPGLQEADLVYDLVAEEIYPVDDRTPEERLAYDVDYVVRDLARSEEYQMPDRYEQAVIPLAKVLALAPRSSRLQWKAEEISDFLRQKYRLTDDGDSVIVDLSHQSSSDSSCVSDYDTFDREDTEEFDEQQASVLSDSELWG